MVTRKKTAAASSTVVSEDNTFQNFITELAALCAKYDTTVPAAVDKTPAAEADEEPAEKPARGRARRGAGKTTAAKPEADEDEPEDEDAEEEGPSRAELEKKSVAVLRKMLNALKTYDPADVKEADKETLIAALLGEDADDDEDDEDAEDVDDAEDSEEDEEDRRAEYEEMTLAQLRKLARDEFDADPSELKPMKKDELIDFLLEPEEDGDADDELDEEEDGYSEEELEAMDVASLEEIADEWELEVDKPGRMTAKAKATYKADLIEAIVEAQDEEEEE